MVFLGYLWLYNRLMLVAQNRKHFMMFTVLWFRSENRDKRKTCLWPQNLSPQLERPKWLESWSHLHHMCGTWVRITHRLELYTGEPMYVFSMWQGLSTAWELGPKRVHPRQIVPSARLQKNQVEATWMSETQPQKMHSTTSFWVVTSPLRFPWMGDMDPHLLMRKFQRICSGQLIKLPQFPFSTIDQKASLLSVFAQITA